MKEIGHRGGRMSLVPPSPDPTIENGSFGNILWNCVNYHLWRFSTYCKDIFTFYPNFCQMFLQNRKLVKCVHFVRKEWWRTCGHSGVARLSAISISLNRSLYSKDAEGRQLSGKNCVYVVNHRKMTWLCCWSKMIPANLQKLRKLSWLSIVCLFCTQLTVCKCTV